MVHRQVAVQWTTNEEAAGAVVQYGTSAGHYTGSATATFDTYTRTDMCGGEAATTGYLFPGEQASHVWCVCLRVCLYMTVPFATLVCSLSIRQLCKDVMDYYCMSTTEAYLQTCFSTDGL